MKGRLQRTAGQGDGDAAAVTRAALTTELGTPGTWGFIPNLNRKYISLSSDSSACTEKGNHEWASFTLQIMSASTLHTRVFTGH